MAHAVRSTAVGATLWARVSNYIDALKVAHAQRRAFLQTVRELNALSDHELWDLGINRGEITLIAMRYTYGS